MENNKREYPLFENSAQEEIRHWRNEAIRNIESTAHKAIHLREKKQSAEKRRAEVQAAHPMLAQTDLSRSTIYTVLLVILVAVYQLDYLLFSPTMEFFSRMVLNSPFMIHLASAVGPAIVLMLEIGVGVQLYLARQKKAETGKRGSYIGWLAVGLFLACVMPLLAVATTLVSRPAVTDAGIANALLFQTASLAILAFVGHALVLFGGKQALEAKVYLHYKIIIRILNLKIRGYEKKFRKLVEEVVDAYRVYREKGERHKGMYPDVVTEPDFDQQTRILINELYGYEVIPVPTGGGGITGHLNGSPVQNSPASEKKVRDAWAEKPVTNRDRESPMLSRILSLHLRDPKEGEKRDKGV
jgi:hypothetical protein